MDDGSPIELEDVEGYNLLDEPAQESVKNAIQQLGNTGLSPKTRLKASRVKDSVRLAKERVNVQKKSGGTKAVSKPTSPVTKLKGAEEGLEKKKATVLKKKNDVTSPKSPKSPVGEKSPKGPRGEKISREKVAKLAKQFDKPVQNPTFYAKMIGLFKKSEFKSEEEAKSPLVKVKSPSNKVKSPTQKTQEGKPSVTFDDELVNNYKAGGMRAREAELNREKKLAETKGLLRQMDLGENARGKPKGAKRMIVKRASKRIPGMLLNKPLEETMSVFGQYPVLVITTSVILFVFFAELIFNKISFNGRCVSKVLYPEQQLAKKPYHVLFGYGACEYNVQQNAEEIGFFGKVTEDTGWPTKFVTDGATVESVASFDSPNYRVFNLFGGLDANHIRNYKESFRLFWSMFMHSGLIHMLFNLLAQTQILWIIEPDFGFARTLSTFIVGGLVGNLSAAVFEPSFNVVGSSGCLFGMISSLIPYCIENWTVLMSPIYIFVFSVIITAVSLSVFNNTVSKYSHFGGWVGGLLWGFATMRNSFNLKDCAIKESILLSPLFKPKLPEEAREKLRISYQNKRSKCLKKLRLEKKDRPLVEKIKKCARAPIDYFKRGPYDIMLRIVPLVVLAVIVTVLCCYLYLEPLYSKVLLYDRESKLSQCCYLYTRGEAKFMRKVFWCFENYETASNFCKKV